MSLFGKLDKSDRGLLLLLLENSRMPVSMLAKKLRISREVASYRIQRLKREGIIIDFVTEININKLGLIGAAIFVNIKAKKHTEFKNFLEKSNFVSWVAELSGVWSFGFSIIGKTNEDLDNKFDTIYNAFKEDIIDHRFSLHRKSIFFYEKYFGKILKPHKKKISSNYFEPDKKDRIILKHLSNNSRMDCVSLSSKLNISAVAVAKRIKKLEIYDFIKKYSIFIDILKLGLYQYSVFVVNKDINEKEKLIQHLSQHKSISFIAEYVCDPFIELGVIVQSPYSVRDVLKGIEEMFPKNRIIEISLFQKEFVSIGVPMCAFNII